MSESPFPESVPAGKGGIPWPVRIGFYFVAGLLNLRLIVALGSTPSLVHFVILGFGLVVANAFLLGGCYWLGSLVQSGQDGTLARKLFFVASTYGIFCVFLPSLCLEVGARIYEAYQVQSKKTYKVPHPVLGWMATPNLSMKREFPGFGAASYSSQVNGFRHWGDPNSSKKRILIIGDSYTQAVQVSDGMTYGDHLKAAFPEYEFFVYGCLGYGTLQESLVAESNLELIKPDVILWQFCGNDLINDVHDLEKRSFQNQTHLVKPYLENHDLVYRFSREYPFGLEKFIPYSSFLRYLLLGYDQCLYKYDFHLSVELLMTEEEIKRSVGVITEIVQRLQTRAGKTIIAGFNVDEGAEIPFICRQARIPYLGGLRADLDKEEKAGKKMTGLPFDQHWNAAGHEAAGRVLAERLRPILKSLNQSQ